MGKNIKILNEKIQTRGQGAFRATLQLLTVFLVLIERIEMCVFLPKAKETYLHI